MIKESIIPRNFNKTLAIIMPVYNEEESLPQTLEEWLPLTTHCQGTLIFLNDGSRDRTWEILKDAAKKHEGKIILIDKANSGHGRTCILAYRWAVGNGFGYIFQTDSDGQTRAEEFKKIWDQKGDRPFIFGKRSHRGDGLLRWIFSRILSLVILLIFKTYVRDANVPFRLMRSSSLKPLLERYSFDLYLANAYLTILIQKNHPIHWEEITFSPRTGGEESVPTLKFLKLGPKVIREFWDQRHHLP